MWTLLSLLMTTLLIRFFLTTVVSDRKVVPWLLRRCLNRAGSATRLLGAASLPGVLFSLVRITVFSVVVDSVRVSVRGFLPLSCCFERDERDRRGVMTFSLNELFARKLELAIPGVIMVRCGLSAGFCCSVRFLVESIRTECSLRFFEVSAFVSFLLVLRLLKTVLPFARFADSPTLFLLVFRSLFWGLVTFRA